MSCIYRESRPPEPDGVRPRLLGLLMRFGPGSGSLVAAVQLYQREISAKRTAPCCRFTPSRSHYAVEALQRYGALRGLLLTAGRLLRCRPYGRRGLDPVPVR
jgi:putative membrane protein insertion efficiency factor